MSLFSSGKPQPLGSLVKTQFEAGRRFLTGSPSIQDLRNLGYTQYCGSTSDCGYGSQCVDGLCRPIGNGNTQYGEGGCSSGSSTPPATLDCITCGYDGEKSCAGTRSCTFTPYGVTCRCGQSSGTGDDGNGGEEGKPCNKYCTTEYASYGSYSEGCSDRNTCSECYSCEGGDADNGNCTKKSRDDGAPCHCDPRPDESCEPRDEVALTCCSYRDTCAGRVEGLYCHETYRTFYPRCYDPDYPDCSGPQPTDEGCIECTYGTVSWNPNQSEPVLDEVGAFPCSEGCELNEVACTDPVSGNCFCRECCPKYGSADELINEDTGDRVTFLECCANKCPGEPGCSSSYDCGPGLCCGENGACVDCVNPTLNTCVISPKYTAQFDGSNFIKSNLCECYNIRVYSWGDGYYNRYQQNTNCSSLSTSSPIETDVLSSWMEFDCSAIAFDVGHATDPSSCTSGTNNCPTYIPGNYADFAGCDEVRYMPRNGILRVTRMNYQGELSYQFFSLWGGNYSKSANQIVEFYVNFEIEVEQRFENCATCTVSSDMYY